MAESLIVTTSWCTMVVNLATSQVTDKLITIRGMPVNDFAQNEFVNFQRDVGKYLVNGDIVYREGIAEGLNNGPEAFVDMLRDFNFGKILDQDRPSITCLSP